MDFFHGFGKRVSNAAKNVSKRTVEATEIARLSNRVTAINEEEDALYRQIGKLYYTARGTDGQEATLEIICERINALQEESASLNRLLDEVRKILRCPACGEQQSDDASYCAKCGTKLIKFEKTIVEPEPIKEEYSPAASEEVNSPSGPSPDVSITWPESTKGEAAEAENTQNN